MSNDQPKNNTNFSKLSDLPLTSEIYHKRIEGEDTFSAVLHGKTYKQILKEEGIEAIHTHALQEGKSPIKVKSLTHYSG